MNDFSETDEPNIESDSVNVNKELKPVLGLALGDPSLFNLFFVVHFDIVTLKLSGAHLSSSTNGFQADLGLKFLWDNQSYHALTIGIGELENDILPRSQGNGWNHDYWEYYSLSYIYGYKGFIVSPGLSIGDGSFKSPHFLLQFGYGFVL